MTKSCSVDSFMLSTELDKAGTRVTASLTPNDKNNATYFTRVNFTHLLLKKSLPTKK